MNDDPGVRTSNLLTRDSPSAHLVTREMLWAEVDRLTRERDQWKERHDRERAAHATNLTQQQKCETERDRLRALLSDVLPQHVDQPRGWAGEWNGGEENAWVGRVRELLSGEPAAQMSDADVDRVYGAGAVKRAYYETHEPPHCPTCGCGSAPETTAKPTDSELYSSSELFRHIWVCPMGWIGDKLIYGPGYTSADMKLWLVKLRRLVGFEHPEGTPLEQPEKANDFPSTGE